MRLFSIAIAGALIAFAFFAALGAPHAVLSQVGTPVTGYAWSDTAGWISMSCSNDSSCGTVDYGVVVDDSGNLTGYAWSETVGWIKFGGLSSFPSGTGTVAQNASFDGDALVGWARACSGTESGDCASMTDRLDGWDGWIALSGSGYGPTLTGGVLDGYAWGSEAIGWIDFSGVGYEVQTAYLPCSTTQNYMCSGVTSVHTAADCSVTEEDCSARGDGWTCSADNGLCLAPPPPVFGTNPDGSSGVLSAKPSLVRKNDPTRIVWTVNNATLCSVTGSNGDAWSVTATPSGGYATSDIQQKTTYTIHCEGGGGVLDSTATVNVTPEFEEK